MYRIEPPPGENLEKAFEIAKEMTFVVPDGTVELVFNDFHFIFKQQTSSYHMNIMWGAYNERTKTGHTHTDGGATKFDAIIKPVRKTPIQKTAKQKEIDEKVPF